MYGEGGGEMSDRRPPGSPRTLRRYSPVATGRDVQRSPLEPLEATFPRQDLVVRGLPVEQVGRQGPAGRPGRVELGLGFGGDAGLVDEPRRWNDRLLVVEMVQRRPSPSSGPHTRLHLDKMDNDDGGISRVVAEAAG